MQGNKIQINLSDITPIIIRSAINPLVSGFSTGFRVINHYQLQYIYRGTGTIDIQGVQYAAAKGDLFFWGPGEEHRITSSKDEPLTILGVQFDLENIHRVGCEDEGLRAFQGFGHYIKLLHTAKAEQLLLEIAHEFKMQTLFFQERMSSLLKAFLLLWARQICSEADSAENTHAVTEEIIQYIHQNFNHNITNQDIGKNFNFHPNHINRMMLTMTGMSLHEYIINVRLNKAVELLAGTDMTVSEIAYAVGFSNVFYFSSLFKKKLGCPPTKMKNS